MAGMYTHRFVAWRVMLTLTGNVDVGNEDLRAQLKTLQYEVDSYKQEKELTNIKHEKELRDAQAKAEADFKRAQVSRLLFYKNDRL